MAKDHTPMWRDLGLDLEAHAALVRGVEAAYAATHLSRRDRPEAMGYWDVFVSELHGARVEELIAAKRQGRKVVGTFCLMVPEELVVAADAVCVGLCAGTEAGTASAARVLPGTTCALVRSLVGRALDRACPYVRSADLLVGETTCDGRTKAYEILGEHVPAVVLEVPRTRTPAARQLWRAEVGRLAAKLEEVTGRPITVERLRAGVAVVNAKRKALARLGRLRRADPPPLAGLDGLLVSQSSFLDDPVRFTDHVNALCDELDARIAERRGVGEPGAPRLVVSGAPMAIASWKLASVVESSGAVVVAEECCVGERASRNLVHGHGTTRDEILDRIAERYLALECAVFTPDADRGAHLVEMIRDAAAAGVVHHALRFCTPYQIESRRMAGILRAASVPVLELETDETLDDVAELTSRVRQFLRTLRRRGDAPP